MGATINGQTFQLANTTLKATAGFGPMFTFQEHLSLNFKIGAKKEPVEDHQGNIVNYTIGKKETDAKATLLQTDYRRFRAWLQQVAAAAAQQEQRPIGIGQVAFDLTVQFGNTIATRMTRKLIGMMLNEEAFDAKSDQKALEVELPFFLMDVTDENDASFIEYEQ